MVAVGEEAAHEDFDSRSATDFKALEYVQFLRMPWSYTVRIYHWGRVFERH